MFVNQKWRIYLFVFLAFCVCSSKHVFIYNEETLVLISFVAFLYFISHYYGNTIKESLNERGLVIKGEREDFIVRKEKSLQELLQEYQKLLVVKENLLPLSGFTNQQLNSAGKSGYLQLDLAFSQQLNEKLSALLGSKTNLQQRLQQVMAANLLDLVLVQLYRLNRKGQKKRGEYTSKSVKNTIRLVVNQIPGK